ncbi:FimV/HubP family polar landmark protein [Thiocystis violascens]|uniref:FimV N-terminal domain protein n=1 Tax=Thiocystis violascens (strain ATCC 17096 / DSM 198 / 6111) TaxID=765911 RepID=I3Y7I7_THIV6|nr:FimV/HubP family polar landmark protein [Thiocystis violascens]AFL72955.1 FimV N-terminal domain protein [Thiocystis violascens DSM 198]
MSRKLILASTMTMTMTMVLAGTDAFALGLGGIQTRSVLNQPFSGEIQLNDVKPDELDAVKVSLASQEAFSKAGIERFHYLTKLTFHPEVSSQGKSVIRVASREPIREPYLDFLVEVYWPTGQLIKEYTVLLDPPVLAKRQAPRVDSPAASGAKPGAARSASDAQRVAASPSNHIPAPGDGFPVYVGPIESGAGLWRLSLNHAPAGATTAQTALALHRNNQGAFIRGNINRLIAGKTLIIPTRAELFALDAATAEREFAEALRGGAVRTAPITEIPPDALSSRLRIAGATSGAVATSPGAARMPPEGATATSPAAAGSPRMEQDLLLALESSESTRQEALELRNRIQELETQLANIQNLLQQRNAEFERIKGAGAAPGVLSGDRLRDVPATSPEDVDALADAVSGELAADAAMAPREGDSALIEPPLPDASLAAADNENPDVSGASDAANDSSATPALIPIPTPAPVARESDPAIGQASPVQAGSPATPIAPAGKNQGSGPSSVDSSSSWQSLLLPLAGFGGLAALGILAFSWVTARRRREEGVEQELYLDTLDFSDTEGTTGFPATRVSAEKAASNASSRQGVDRTALSETPLIPADEDMEEPESPLALMSSLSDFDAETDEADVLSEADIYIAYGRHSEAKELLFKELKLSPDRLDIKFKLAEAYAGAQDAQGLKEIMQSIESAGGAQAQPEQWKRLQEFSAQVQSGGNDGSGLAAPPVELAAQPRGADRESVQKPGDSVAGSLNLKKAESQDDSPLKFSDDTLADILSEPVSLGDLVFEEDSLDLELPPHAGDRKDDLHQDPFADIAHEPIGIDSELMLTLDETRLDLAEELDSMFDSTLLDEPALARNERLGTGPSAEDLSHLPPSDSQDRFDSGLTSERESVPTEDLSSQWQMDSGIWDETATKLDLARAYVEMDDAEAAREILQEVIAEGRDEQKTEARALLEKLA